MEKSTTNRLKKAPANRILLRLCSIPYGPVLSARLIIGIEMLLQFRRIVASDIFNSRLHVCFNQRLEFLLIFVPNRLEDVPVIFIELGEILVHLFAAETTAKYQYLVEPQSNETVKMVPTGRFVKAQVKFPVQYKMICEVFHGLG